MSIVGTRPPTLDEWNKYELHHRARLAIKPGMSKVDKSLYCFELSPTEFMKRSGKVSVKETDRPEISELRSLAVEKIEKMYEDRHTILKIDLSS